jgi:hypothetical protein
VKKISLICCLLFGMPANAATKEERMSSCMEMHTALFQSALGGAPYEHLLQVVNFYGSVLKEGEEDVSWLISMPRSCRRSSTLRSESGNRT